MTWALLAALLVTPHPQRRAVLAERFWSEPPSLHPGSRRPRSRSRPPTLDRLARKSLTIAFADLRSAFGDDCFVADTTSVQAVRSRFVTDLDRLRTLRRELAAASGHARRPLLDTICALVPGPFLEGCDRFPDSDGWLARERAQVGELVGKAMLERARLFEEAGAPHDAFPLLMRTVELWPDESVSEALWRTAAAVGRRDDAARRLSELGFALPSERVRPSVPALSPAHREVLERLSVFVAPFPLAWAIAVGKVSEARVRELADAGMLVERDARFALNQEIVSVLRADPGRRRARLAAAQQAYARCVAALVASDGVTLENREETAEHLCFARDWMLACAAAAECLDFLDGLFSLGFDIDAAIPWLERRVEDRRLRPGRRLQVAILRARIAWSHRRFAAARAWWARATEAAGELEEWDVLIMALNETAIASHHGGFLDEAIVCAREAIALCRQRGDLHWEGNSWYILAEAQLASGDPAAARASCEASLAHRRAEPGQSGRVFGALRHLRARILRALGETDAALEDWNAALALFRQGGDTHGVADCLCGMAPLRAGAGAPGEAIALVEYAMRLYAEVGDLAAVAAAEGDLGDLLRAQGDTDGALRHYARGLDYWERQEHPRWPRHFEARIAAARGDASPTP